MARKPSPRAAPIADPADTERPASLSAIAASDPGASLEGIAGLVRSFPDRDTFLASPHCYDSAFYVVGSEISLGDGVELIRLLKRRTAAGLLAWRTRAPAAAWLDAGADLWLPRSATTTDLLAGVRAVQRRLASSPPLSAQKRPAWRLDTAGKTLHTPKGVVIALGESNFAVMSAFAAARGETVPYATLNAIFDHKTSEADNALHAAMYRLRRRVERATEEPLPLSSRAGVGYAFRAELLDL